ncbi:hypothetical protein GQ42DRAFT_70036 [Ramicandelaber brevisporus]|nr:hypothetical protein GQ42DRAFT_70036 [Ramicandelaber brevisporus]
MKVYVAATVATALVLAAAVATAVPTDPIPCGGGMVNGHSNPLCKTSYVNYYINDSPGSEAAMGRCEYQTVDMEKNGELTTGKICASMWPLEKDQVNCVVKAEPQQCEKIKKACKAFGKTTFHAGTHCK